MMKTVWLFGPVLLAGMGQMPATPPVKMGLWESSINMKMAMPGAPNGMPGMGPRTMSSRSCLTPDSYAKNLAASQQQKSCVLTNQVWSEKKYSFDMVCEKTHSTGHFEMFFDSREAGHGNLHMDISMGKQSMTMDSTIDMHFVSADCGAVSPDKPVIMH